MKKRIVDNTCFHNFEINQIVNVDAVGSEREFKSESYYFDSDDCEDFDHYRPGDKVAIKRDTHHHGFEVGEVVEIIREHEIDRNIYDCKNSEGRSRWVPECDFDCYEEGDKEMKYKVGDKVVVLNEEQHHYFKKGEVITITEVMTNNYVAVSEENRSYYVYDEDIKPYAEEPTPTIPLITREHDYKGCDPEIAAALKKGLDVYCEVWDDVDRGNANKKTWVYGYDTTEDDRYITRFSFYNFARPTKNKPKIKKLVPKPASEIFAWLENPENGYQVDGDGNYKLTRLDGYIHEPEFIPKNMLKYCGTNDCGWYDWHPAWLREIEVEEEDK